MKNQIPSSYLDPDSNDSMCKNLEKSSSFPQELQEEINEEIKELPNENFLNELEFMEQKIEHKPRYPLLAVDTKPTENDVSEKETDFFKESLRENLKKNEESKGFGKEIELKFRNQQGYIRNLNSNLCDFKDYDLMMKKSIESFRGKEENSLFERKKGMSEIERRWKEEMKVLKGEEEEGTKGRREFIDYDLEFVLKNRKNHQKSLY